MGSLSAIPALVQGASRGIGLEFVRQLLARGEGPVIATCRNPAEATQLRALAASAGAAAAPQAVRGQGSGNRSAEAPLTILPLDATNEDSIAAAAVEVRDRFGALGLLVNCAGVLHGPGGMRPETSFQALNPAAMLLAYQVNAVGPALVAKHMLPLLAASNGGGGRGGRGVAVLACLSARVGSIGDNRLGGWHSYRASKAALNQLMRTISVEAARKKLQVATILLHPGTVDTDMSKPFQRNVPEGKLFSPALSVEHLLTVIHGVGPEDNGKFFAWDGQEIPW